MQRPSESHHVDALLAERQIGQYYSFVEAVLFRDSREASRLLADDFVEHGNHGERSGTEFLASLDARRCRFPHAVWTIDLLAGSGDLVVCHTTMTTRHEGVCMRAQETAVIRFSAGKIAECWRTSDDRS